MERASQMMHSVKNGNQNTRVKEIGEGIYDLPMLTLSSQPYYVTTGSHEAIYKCLESKRQT